MNSLQAALPPIPVRIARGLDALGAPASVTQVSSAVALLDGGATVPFIARYRKEATGGLDDVQLRALVQLLTDLRDLERRRDEILRSVADQGALTPELEAELRAAEIRERLDDLYLPYRPKYRSPGQVARERGLEPLADALLAHSVRLPADQAAAFVDPDKEVATADDALAGARSILVERMAEDAELVASIRDRARREGLLRVEVVEGKEAEGARFRDWFSWQEPIATVPGHRALAFLRGRREEILRLTLVLDEDHPGPLPPTAQAVAARFGIRDQGRPGDAWLLETARIAARWRIGFHVELSLVEELRKRAHAEAIDVFAKNMRDVLLAAPAGPRPTMGLDPGLRTGVKVAVVDGTGKVLDATTVHPHPPRKGWQGSLAILRLLVERHDVEMVAVGNGTASRETDKLAAELCKACPGLTRVVVSEAGASVYSASELASRELPELDVSLRGAASIARRLQDPLAELVKIDPKSVGVGQYQHDVDEYQLSRALDGAVEDCVNAVGVDLNTASPALLRRVAGLDEWSADEIVRWRDANGAFASRQALRESLFLPARTYEQCAGFLRIRGGADPLDASAVHPEAYPVVHRILEHTGRSVEALMGDDAFLSRLDPRRFVDERFGLPTVQDILAELAKPGRDPRPCFQTARFADGVETLADLKPGMKLEGTVTNVTAFGAFVDIGVHQDGLMHISQLADRFIEDPRQVVRTGQTVKVTVLDIDRERKRIALSMKSQPTSGPSAQRGSGRRSQRGRGDRSRAPARKGAARAPAAQESPSLGTMAAALQSALGEG